MSADDALAPGTRLLRVLKDKPVHVDPVTRLPTPAAFEPSSADLAHAPVRVSVWDADHVPLTRAIELRGGGELMGFVLTVADVVAVANELAASYLRAVKDPDGARNCDPDEARWHYGIEGLEGDAWRGRRADRQHALRALARACQAAT